MKIIAVIVLFSLYKTQMIVKKKKIKITDKATLPRKSYIRTLMYKLPDFYLYIYLRFPKHKYKIGSHRTFF